MNGDFIEALEAIEREKGITKDVLIEAIEAALISGYKEILIRPKTYGWM